MTFFNFELTEDSFAKEPIKIPKELAEKLPKDYVKFLNKYNDIEAKDGDGIYIDIKGKNIDLIIFGYNKLKRDLGSYYPDIYIPIASDYHFDCILMSTRKEDFGRIYYMNLEMYWEFVCEKETEEKQINGIKNNAILVANSFTDFTHKLHDTDK